MHAHHIFGPFGHLCNAANGQRRCVGCKNHIFVAGFFHLRQHAVLQGEVFKYRLNNQRHVANAAIIQRGAQPGEFARACRRVQSTPFHTSIKYVCNVLYTTRQTCIIAVLQAHINTLVYRYISNTGTHQSGAQHAHLLYGARLHARVMTTVVLL